MYYRIIRTPNGTPNEAYCIKINDSVHSLERNSEDGMWQPSFLLRHIDNTSQVVKLTGRIDSYDILSIHADDTFLYSVESNSNDGTYFIGKYNQNYEFVSYFEITDLYTNQKVTNGIKSFYVLDGTAFTLQIIIRIPFFF